MTERVYALAIVAGVASSFIWSRACIQNTASENNGALVYAQGGGRWVTMNGHDYSCEPREEPRK